MQSSTLCRRASSGNFPYIFRKSWRSLSAPTARSKSSSTWRVLQLHGPEPSSGTGRLSSAKSSRKKSRSALPATTQPAAVRLLDACRRSQNPHLAAVVTVALNTGMRRGEVMGLTCERVDLARGVLMLEETKNGRRCEVPMNRAVYDALAALTGANAEGPVFRKSSGAAW